MIQLLTNLLFRRTQRQSTKYFHCLTKRLLISKNTVFQGMQLKCIQRISTAEQESEFLQKQLLQEQSLEKSIGFMEANRDIITTKLESKDFNPGW